MSRPVPVAVFIDRFAPGGTQRQTLELLARLDRRRFRVYPVCFHREGAWFDRATRFDEPATLFPIYGFRRPHTWRQFLAFARWCREKQIQVLHTCELYSNVFALPAGALVSVPVRIGSRRGFVEPPGLQRLQRVAYTAAHSILANSQAAADRLQIEGVPGHKVRVIPNGVDTAAFPPRVYSHHPRRIVVIACLREEKRIDVLIAAAPRILSRHPDAELVIAGEGLCRPALEAQARELGIAARVTFLGHRDDVANVLAPADVFVLPSRSEALPNSIMEAMASGLPVVASAVGGIPELVRDGQTGRLVPPGDASALADAILDLLDHPDRLAEFGRAGRKAMERTFAFERMVDRIEALYETELDARLSAASAGPRLRHGRGNLPTDSGNPAAERRVS